MAAAAITFAVAFQLFDRSLSDMVAWGDEELAVGHTDVAAQIFLRAMKRAPDAEKHQLVERVAQTCRAMDDPRAATELALQIVELAPDISFGRHDYLVAQALVSRERARSPIGSIDIWRTAPTKFLQLVKRRLEMALSQGLPPERALEAEETLSAIKLVLSNEQPVIRFVPDYLYELPKSGSEELERAVADGQQPLWNRARAAIALGRQLEAEGQLQPATRRFEQALGFVRQVYPIYAGAKASNGAIGSQREVPDAEECLLVRQLVADLHRLSPDSMPMPKGAIEFGLEGIPLPAEAVIDLVVELFDPAIDDPDAGLPHSLPRLIPLKSDRPMRFQVLDGTYRLRCRGHRALWRPSAERAMRLLQVETDRWPQLVEVRGQTLKLPPARLRLAEEIELSQPTDGDLVDLPSVEFQWQAVAGATTYHVQFLYSDEQPSPSKTYFLTVKTTEPRVKLTDLSHLEQKQIARNLRSGRTGGWRVDALDSQGKRVGQSIAEFRFLVASPLEQD